MFFFILYHSLACLNRPPCREGGSVSYILMKVLIIHKPLFVGCVGLGKTVISYVFVFLSTCHHLVSKQVSNFNKRREIKYYRSNTLAYTFRVLFDLIDLIGLDMT